MLAPKDSVKLKNRRERQSPGKAEEIPRKEKEVSAETNWDTIAGSSFDKKGLLTNPETFCQNAGKHDSTY